MATTIMGIQEVRSSGNVIERLPFASSQVLESLSAPKITAVGSLIIPRTVRTLASDHNAPTYLPIGKRK